MGTDLYDSYSLLHFSVGTIAWYWGVGFWPFVLFHVGFEFVENTEPGMRFINTYFTAWPGGKPRADTFINMVGDLLAAAMGWLYAELSGWFYKKYM